MKRLEKNQIIVLTNVVQRGGRWKADGKWSYGTDHRTENVLIGLSQIGLFDRVGEHRNFGVFEITKKGDDVFAGL
jgi:hypothetical protein